MKFKLIIDPNQEEEVVATVHRRSPLIDEMEALIARQAGSDRIPGYTEDDIKLLTVSEIACITVLDGKVYAIDMQNCRYRLKARLYELEQQLPASFIRINKSALANEAALDRVDCRKNVVVEGSFIVVHVV